jgi:hypothetical protein
MNRILCAIVLGLLALSSTGCVWAAGNRTRIESSNRQAVAVDGEIYVVNVKSGAVWKVDQARLETADPFNEAEVEVEVDAE